MLRGKAKTILKKLGINPNEINFKILAGCVQAGVDLELPVERIPILSSLHDELTEVQVQYLLDAKDVGKIEDYPFDVQKGLTSEDRKANAAFYTGRRAARAMIKSMEEFVEGEIILCDPFCGGGTLLSVIARELDHRIRYVYGMEKMRFPAMVAMVSVLNELDYMDYYKVIVKVGDSFATTRNMFFGSSVFRNSMLPKPNVIVTNPPYLNWNRVGERGRITSEWLIGDHGYDITGNYTAQGTFLGDLLLEEGGLYCTILPISTFYNSSTRKIMDMFRDRYNLKAIVARKGSKPYSLLCDLIDLLFIAVKEKGDGRYHVGIIDDENLDSIITGKGMHPIGIETSEFGQINPGAYILNPGIAGVMDEIINRLDRVPCTRYGRLHHNPSLPSPLDFFFVPNEKWDVVQEEEEKIVISNGSDKLEIDEFEKVLLRPVFGRNQLVAKPSHYGLVFHDMLDENERKYVESWNITGSNNWWTSYRDVVFQRPRGHVFLARVLNLVLNYYAGPAFYMEKPMSQVSSFFMFESGDEEINRIATSWWNSLPFISCLRAFGRKLVKNTVYTTMMTFENMPFPNIDTMSKNEKKYFSRIEDIEIKPFKEIIPRPHDIKWMEFVGAEDLTEGLVDAFKSATGSE